MQGELTIDAEARVFILERRMSFIRDSIQELILWLKEHDIDADETNSNEVSLDSCVSDIVTCVDFDNNEPETWKIT